MKKLTIIIALLALFAASKKDDANTSKTNDTKNDPTCVSIPTSIKSYTKDGTFLGSTIYYYSGVILDSVVYFNANLEKIGSGKFTYLSSNIREAKGYDKDNKPNQGKTIQTLNSEQQLIKTVSYSDNGDELSTMVYEYQCK